MNPYTLTKALQLIETALFLPEQRALIVADLQLGREGELRRHGQNVRYRDGEDIQARLTRLCEQLGATTIVINGDLKHEFGRINAQERRSVLELLTQLKRHARVIIVRGNHDTITAPLAHEAGVAFVDEHRIGDVLCIHGHQEPRDLKNIRTIVIGHVHPAITLTDGIRKETCKCFLASTYKRKRLIVLPSTSAITEGTNVLTQMTNSPLLTKRSVAASDIYVIADEIRPFGTVQKLRTLTSS